MRFCSSPRVAAVLGAALVGLALHASSAHADAIITNSSGIVLGVNDLGNLDVSIGPTGTTPDPYNSQFVGLYFAAVDGDATSPGCLCEGFGVSAENISGWVTEALGSTNLTSVSFSNPDSSTAIATASLTTGASLQVTHDYHPSASSALYEVVVTLTNTGATALADVRYNRTMDWDIPPTTFDEYVTIQRQGSTALIDSCNNGFQSADPLEDCEQDPGAPAGGVPIYQEDADFVDFGSADHGARFTFGFGSLGAGESVSFKIFYGAAATEAAALNALGTVAAEVYSFGQCSAGNDDHAGEFGDERQPAGVICGGPILGSPATFIFAFAGVGGTPVPSAVPEPTSMLLVGTGGLVAYWGRRRRASGRWS
jgi:type IV pilus assembly protein PilY1